MDRYSLFCYSTVPRWASLKINHMGKSYYVVPEVLAPYSTTINSSNLNNEIFLPNIDGPITDFIFNLYSGAFPISKDNAAFYYAIGICLSINSLADAAKQFLQYLSDPLLLDLAIKLAELSHFPKPLISLLCRSSQELFGLVDFLLAPLSLIERIIFNIEFKPTNPMVVVQFLYSRMIRNPEFKDIFEEQLKIQNLENDDIIIKLLASSHAINLNQYAPIFTSQLLSFCEKGFSFSFSPGTPINGVISHLYNENGGDLIQKRMIEFESSTIFSDRFVPQNLIDYSSPDVFFCTKIPNDPNSYFTIKILIGSIRLESYVWESHWTDKGCIGPISWVVEGSNDGQNWISLDHHDNDTSLISTRGPINFKCIHTNESFSQFRFSQIECNGKNNKRFILSTLELYGYLSLK